MRAKGLTLLETLVALGIVVTVLGSSVLATRSIAQAALASEEHVTLADIAQKSLDMVNLVTVANPTLITAAWVGQGQPVFFEPDPNGTNAVGSCRQEDLANTAAPCAGTAAASIRTSASSNIQEVAAELNGADLVGVSRLAIPADGQNSVLVDSLTLPAAATPLNVNTNSGKWTFYTRKVQILPVSATFAADNGQSVAGAAQTDLQTHTFEVVVTVTNYGNPQSTLRSAMTVTTPL